jgi:hypothetical protein
MPYLKTSAAADLLGIPYYTLAALMRSRRLLPPSKDSSGDYVWTPDDIDRARAALAARRRRRRQPEEVASAD